MSKDTDDPARGALHFALGAAKSKLDKSFIERAIAIQKAQVKVIAALVAEYERKLSKTQFLVEAVKGHYDWQQEHDPNTSCSICRAYSRLKEPT